MEETISLKEIFEVIRKRLLLIIAFVFGAALIAAIVSYFVITPTYEAKSEFIVNQGELDPSQFNVNDIRTNVELINTYNDIIKSPAITEKVIDSLKLSLTPSSLADKVQVSSSENSQVVTVAVTDESPALAVQIANTTVEIFQKEVLEIMNVDNVSVLASAEMAEDPSPVAPKPMLNIAIAIVLGGMVGVGLAFLLEYLDNTIRTEQDIDTYLGLPVIGTVSTIEDSDIRDGQAMFQRNRQRRGGFSGAAQKKTS